MELVTIDRSLEIKSVSETGSFSGYGAVFGNVDRDLDVIEPGAFTKTLAEHKRRGPMPPLLWQHRFDRPIGAFTTLREDQKGLYVEGELALKTSKGSEAYELLKIGAVGGLSVGFCIPNGGKVHDRGGVRRIKQIELWEISLVPIPANPEAVVSEVKGAIENKTSLERFLRNAGMSRAQAKALIAGGYSYLNPRQADADGLASLGAKAQSLTANILHSMKGI